jgi:hypothetical protein
MWYRWRSHCFGDEAGRGCDVTLQVGGNGFVSRSDARMIGVAGAKTTNQRERKVHKHMAEFSHKCHKTASETSATISEPSCYWMRQSRSRLLDSRWLNNTTRFLPHFHMNTGNRCLHVISLM